MDKNMHSFAAPAPSCPYQNLPGGTMQNMPWDNIPMDFMDEFLQNNNMSIPPQNNTMNIPPQNNTMNIPPQNNTMNTPSQNNTMNIPPQNNTMNIPPQNNTMNTTPQRCPAPGSVPQNSPGNNMPNDIMNEFLQNQISKSPSQSNASNRPAQGCPQDCPQGRPQSNSSNRATLGVPCPTLGQFPCEPCTSPFNNVPLSDLPIAMAYVPFQTWGAVYEAAQGLNQGTIFPNLDLPFEGRGVI